MIKNLLKGVAVVLAVAEIIALWFFLTLAEPYGRIPGGRLSGEEVEGVVTDWNSVMTRRRAGWAHGDREHFGRVR